VEWELFEGLFEEFWQGIENEEEEEENEIPQAQLECGEDDATELFQEVKRDQDEGGEEDACREEPTEQATYSPVARLLQGGAHRTGDLQSRGKTGEEESRPFPKSGYPNRPAHPQEYAIPFQARIYAQIQGIKEAGGYGFSPHYEKEPQTGW
jgi:hypothetical protein